jgi:uncharacterized C2H2 Zn-finger protein
MIETIRRATVVGLLQNNRRIIGEIMYQGQNRQPIQYVSDKIKQFLISRGTARDRAVELCCAGKIELKQIPDYTDRLTILHFGQISVSPSVDAEILRIAARCTERQREREMLEAQKVEKPKTMGDDQPEGHPTDQETAFDVEKEREQYEKERVEEDHQAVEFGCVKCGKKYKTQKGLTNHINKVHKDPNDEGNYGDQR